MKRLLIFTTTALILLSCSTSKKTSSETYDNLKLKTHESRNLRTYGSPKLKQELIDDYTFKITQYSQDSTYGYTEENPVMVGGVSEGPKNQRRFLNALSGPNGERIKYYRIGSCCPFETENSAWGGMLDKYDVTYEGLEKSLIIYINLYDSDTLKVPVGLKLKY
ncbi:MAG TPA: hypothetical protein PLF32_01295 [Bacteroidales bacterium]|nr:hypothetical protein [Bacteroidales bacterium]HOR81275.1 hypothetical protein [Bacteroidales bacterium]HPJ90542.1 hypothetical protein [Bacteroidales bacterium]